jgi:hypothetical protein
LGLLITYGSSSIGFAVGITIGSGVITFTGSFLGSGCTFLGTEMDTSGFFSTTSTFFGAAFSMTFFLGTFAFATGVSFGTGLITSSITFSG